MILQDSPAGCGAASLCNALQAAGVRIPQETAWKLTGCTGTRGTTERGLIRAITTLGHRANQLREADPGIALMTLRGYLLHGVPCIVLLDQAGHWAVTAGTLGQRICLVDSADGGVLSCLEPDDFLRRWECPGEKRPYYAIALIARRPA